MVMAITVTLEINGAEEQAQTISEAYRRIQCAGLARNRRVISEYNRLTAQYIWYMEQTRNRTYREVLAMLQRYMQCLPAAVSSLPW